MPPIIRIKFLLMTNSSAWREYQEEAAAFFRELGLEAETDARVEGVRTAHDVDVLVTFHHAGLNLKWLVECKHWKRRINKLHVLGLREIVSDVGAIAGYCWPKRGFSKEPSKPQRRAMSHSPAWPVFVRRHQRPLINKS
ncbi:restriction endonuclease [Pseudarthrobacter phenanthrenivorans]|uniref:restriction endonuclease n=1 Tax=Pseudarthrobacter phenanthrenivorans TaxID=361575 RepID=UPI0034500C11